MVNVKNVQKKPNCTECSTTSYKCAICTEGYYVDSNGECQLLTNIHCSKFGSYVGKCTECLSDYYLTGGGKCEECSTKDECKTCSQTEDSV